jgi:tRNA 2-thiouridine synthesizing protein A
MAADMLHVNARGMKCPWPALRAARAMREADAVLIEADDPIAPSELEALFNSLFTRKAYFRRRI